MSEIPTRGRIKPSLGGRRAGRDRADQFLVDPHRQISVAVLFAGNADPGVDQVFANLLAVLQK
jgi:hypothetical protein